MVILPLYLPDSTSFYQFVPLLRTLGPQTSPTWRRVFFKASLIHDKLPGHFATRIKHLGKKGGHMGASWFQCMTSGPLYDPGMDVCMYIYIWLID